MVWIFFYGSDGASLSGRPFSRIGLNSDPSFQADQAVELAIVWPV